MVQFASSFWGVLNPPSTKHFLWVQLSFSSYTCNGHKKNSQKTFQQTFNNKNHPHNFWEFSTQASPAEPGAVHIPFVSIGCCRSSADITCLKVPKVHCVVSWHHLVSHHTRSKSWFKRRLVYMTCSCVCVCVVRLRLGKICWFNLSGCLWFGCCGRSHNPKSFWCLDARDMYSSENLSSFETWRISYWAFFITSWKQASKQKCNKTHTHLPRWLCFLLKEIIIGEVLFVQTNMFGMKQETAGPTIMQGCNILSTMFCFSALHKQVCHYDSNNWIFYSY